MNAKNQNTARAVALTAAFLTTLGLFQFVASLGEPQVQPIASVTYAQTAAPAIR